MKLLSFKRAKIAVLMSCMMVSSSCVNEINSDITTGTIPIKFSTKVSNNNTRVTNTSFQKGDKVGLYATLSSNSIKGKRYINNLKLECGDKGTLIPEKTVFYPEGDATLDFFSYYPYQPADIPEGTSTISVSVKTDQNNTGNYSTSDFLVATRKDVASSDEAVVLQYHHKFSKIKISILPEPGEDIAELYKDNPNITITGFKTKATYDIESETFMDLSEEADIIPTGEWKIENDALTGKELIIIPQDIQPDEKTITMEWNGVMYNCPIPELKLSESTQCKINIKAMQTTSYTLTGIVGEIEDWGPEVSEDSKNNGAITTVHLAALSFKKSDIYTVYHKGEPIAEVCKEYLNSDDIASRAIVAYPVKDEKRNLGKGLLLKLLDDERAICGGSIKWDTDANTFTYSAGAAQSLDRIYFDEEGNMLSEKPEKPISIDIISRTIKDIRAGDLYEYPIVKIGTQYWMREDLCATKYSDGVALTKKGDLGDGPGYFRVDITGPYFYNGEAVLNGNLAPLGWRIPNPADWEKLKTYCRNDASLLKAGEWEAMDKEKDPVCAGNNLTDFSAYSVGIWGNGDNIWVKQLTAYWTLDNASSSIPTQSVSFTGSNKEFTPINTLAKNQTYYKAFSIRCIEE